MGGVKNRDEKRKNAKVFSSGAGGGSKGPSVLDKRGQEEKCPHCDRVFKQSGRLRDHIAKQHAEQLQPEAADAGGSSSSSGANAVGAGAAVVAGAGGSGVDRKGGPPKAGASTSSSASASQKGAALAAAAAAAAASCSKAGPGPAGSKSSSSTTNNASNAGTSSSSSSNSGPRMFDVGSRGGFYTEKSPKLMLHEWCTQQKRPKPKYKAVAVDPEKGGGYRARVVLPDAKHPGSDKDVVVWLDTSFAVASEDEAMQRGAVAALQAVAGERSLDYVLPQRYRPLWSDLKTQAAERAEQQRRAAAAAAQSKARQASARAASSARAPVAVVMSDKQREAVEGLLLMQDDLVGGGSADLLGGGGIGAISDLGGSGSGAGAGSAGTGATAGDDSESDQEELAEAASQFIEGLVRTGFSAADAAAAVRAVGSAAGVAAAGASAAASTAAAAGGRRVTRVWRSHEGLQPYLDWLCIRLPVERLPSKYRPGGSSGTVGVLRLNSSSNNTNNTNTPAAAAAAAADNSSSTIESPRLSWQYDPHVTQLVSHGYPPDHAMSALQAAGGHMLTALAALQQQLLTGCSSSATVGGGSAAAAVQYAGGGSSSSSGIGSVGSVGSELLPQEWVDEVEVLRAIYGDELMASPASDSSSESTTPGAITLAVDAGSQVPGGKLLLHVWCPTHPTPYPAAAPLLALSYSHTSNNNNAKQQQQQPPQPQPLLLHLTRQLAIAAAGLLGDPMVHELAVTLAEGLEQHQQQQQQLQQLPPPFDRPVLSAAAAVGGGESGDGDDSSGYTAEAQQHAAAAEALLGDEGGGGSDGGGDSSSTISSSSRRTAGSSSVSSSSSSSRGGQQQQQQRRRGNRQLSPQQQEAESRRLQQYFRDLQVDRRHASMRATRASLPAASCRQSVLDAVAGSDVVVISGATGCGKSTQVPQYLLEQAVQDGRGGSTNIIVCQPRRIAAVGLASRVAAELGDPAGVGGLCGYSVRLDTKVSDATRLMFVTTGVLLRRLMGDPQLTGVTHIVLDEVHERNLESDLLLMLLRRTLLLQRQQQAHGSSSSSVGSATRAPKVLLMSATADAQLFGDYFARAGPEALLMNNINSNNVVNSSSSSRGGVGSSSSRGFDSSSSSGLGVSLLSIPGFTHPVRQLWLEDALQQTGVVIGKQSKYAKKKKPKSGGFGGNTNTNAAAAAAADSSWLDSEDDDGDDEGEEGEEGDVGVQPGKQQQQQQQQQRRQPAQAGSKSNSSSTTSRCGQRGGGVGVSPADAPTGNYSPEVVSSLQVVDPSLINYELIESLLLHIVNRQQRGGPTALLQGWANAPPGALEAAAAKSSGASTELGAVLVFMPGAPEIDRLVRQLQGSSRLSGAVGGGGGRGGGLRVLPLHGGLPPAVQARVFERPPPGVLKVVVSTNVAETSLTIDDVTVVIDTGRHKEMSYDPSRGLSRLSETWVSQAAAQQRRGRAGRVRPGVCYRLFPSRMWSRLDTQQPPEVLRVPLQQLCLTTKAALRAALPDGAPQPPLPSVLSCLLTPPPSEAVGEAVQQLTALGALQQQHLVGAVQAQGQQQQQQQQQLSATTTAATEVLTPLGEHLSDMPMDAALGKALLYGCMLRCASPLLTIAAALAHGRPLWVSPPPDKRGEAEAARNALAAQAFAQRSDHLAVIAAFNAWSAAKAAGGRGAAADFARQHFMSDQVLEAIAKGRLDFANTLSARGFLPGWYTQHLAALQHKGMSAATATASAAAAASGGGIGGDVYGPEAVCPGGPDEYSHNSRIIKAAIAAGFYPRILRVEAPVRYQQVSGGAMRVEAEAGSIRFFERGLGRVWLHPASVCFKAGSYPSGWLVFTQLVETSRPFVREASMVPVYALLAFGGQLEVLHDQGLLLLDGWAKFKAPARVGVLIQHLRQAVSALLAAKVQDPSLDLSGQRVVQALHSLLATDGF